MARQQPRQHEAGTVVITTAPAPCRPSSTRQCTRMITESLLEPKSSLPR